MPEVMLADPRLSLPLRRAWAVFAAVVAVYLVVLGVGWATDGPVLPIDVHEGIQFLLMLNAAVLVLWRAREPAGGPRGLARARRRLGRVDSGPARRDARVAGRRGGAVPVGGRTRA